MQTREIALTEIRRKHVGSVIKITEMQVWWIFMAELVKIFCCTEKCSRTNQKQIPTCWFQTLLRMCSIRADLSPSCVYGSLVRSAASVAALTFSLASSETKRVPSHQQTSWGIKEIFLYRTRLCEMCSFLPLATHKTFVVSPSSPVYMRAPLRPRLFPQQTPALGTGQPAGDSVESQANTGPAWQTSHLCVCMGTSGLPRLAGPSVCLPVCLTVRLHTHCWCVLVLSWNQNFYSYTGTGLKYKNNHYNTKANKLNVT